MSKFTDTVKQDTPRLVVMFKRTGDQEQYQWGMVGKIPLLSLVGAVVRVQGELPLLEPSDPKFACPQQALVLAWDDERRRFDWFVHDSLPTDSLVGMLETIKVVLTGSQLARQAASQQVSLVGLDGKPLRG